VQTLEEPRDAVDEDRGGDDAQERVVARVALQVQDERRGEEDDARAVR
jgi:hypothetical protein